MPNPIETVTTISPTKEPENVVTPTLDRLQYPEACLQALKRGEDALIASNIVDELAEVGRELAEKDQALHVRVRVVGPVESVVNEVAEGHARFTGGLSVSAAKPHAESGVTPRISLEVAPISEQILLPGEEVALSRVKPVVTIDATPLDLQINYHQEIDGKPPFQDFVHGSWARDGGKMMFQEAVGRIRSSLLGEAPTPVPVLQ